MTLIRSLQPTDLDEVLAVYRDAVITQAAGLYSQSQISAWADHARADPAVATALQRGFGLASCASGDRHTIEAFALLDPPDRLALLYCRGRSSRQGRGRALLTALEAHARARGERRLRTEASRLSRPLLERLGWQVEAPEDVIFAGQPFHRWRMIRDLC